MEDKRTEKGNITKEKILKASLQLLDDEGIRGFTSKNIAERAGITKSLIFHHYSSVEDIFKDIVQHLSSEILKEGLKLNARTPANYFVQIFKFIDSEFYGKHRKAIISIQQKACYDEEFRKSFIKVHESAVEQFKDNFINKFSDQINLKNLDRYLFFFKTISLGFQYFEVLFSENLKAINGEKEMENILKIVFENLLIKEEKK